MSISAWGATLNQIDDADRKRVVDEVAGQFSSMSLTEMRSDREKLLSRIIPQVQTTLNRFGLQTMDVEGIAREVIARVGGLGRGTALRHAGGARDSGV